MFTHQLGSDIRLIPTTTSLTAKQLARLFFKEWYCENGLPLEIVSNCDKLFISRFWKALHKLTGIKLKMSSAYHPQSDGSSERTNKTVIQCIRFAVEWDQRGWVQALPKVRFDIMNTLNASTGFTPFQLHFGRSACMLPPIVPPIEGEHEEISAQEIIANMRPTQLEAQDNLLEAKISQAFQANKSQSLTFPFKVGDQVILSTANRRREYKSGNEHRVAKFMPRFDGPYSVTTTDERHSTVTLKLPDHSGHFPIFHTSEVKPFRENNNTHFPTRALSPPDPVLIDGQPEFFVEKIVDERRQGKRTQYLVRWRGEGPKGDIWLPESELEDCQALDEWIARRTSTLSDEDSRKLIITIPLRSLLQYFFFSCFPFFFTAGKGVSLTQTHNVTRHHQNARTQQ